MLVKDKLVDKLDGLLEGEELLRSLTVLPRDVPIEMSTTERLLSLMNIYKIYIPDEDTKEIYHRLYIATLMSLEKKDTILETKLLNDNYKNIKFPKRYGVIGGLESFKITGKAGVGKTSSIQRCMELISNKGIIRREKPYREVIPILVIECVADGSFKSLLYSILQAVDERLDTSFFGANKHVTTTVDSLLSAVSNVLTNHVGLLIIDEIERVANDSKKGETLINYLTQLVNQSNISICFVGNESANQYFKNKEYLARRTFGLSLRKMNYDLYLSNFLKILFRYQYTEEKCQLDSSLSRVFYNLSNGSKSVIVSLFVESQRRAILKGSKSISEDLVIETFNELFSNIADQVENKRVENKKLNHKKVDSKDQVVVKNNIFMEYSLIANKDIKTFIDLIKNKVVVEFVK